MTCSLYICTTPNATSSVDCYNVAIEDMVKDMVFDGTNRDEATGIACEGWSQELAQEDRRVQRNPALHPYGVERCPCTCHATL